MCWRRFRRKRKQISILVPFQTTEPFRVQSWEWLRQYWEAQLPHAEIVIGKDRKSRKRWYRRHPKPFSKSAAINYAAKRARGDVFFIVDSDVWLDAAAIESGAERIRMAVSSGVHLWYMPYRRLFRLTTEASQLVLESDPKRPFWYRTPPLPQDVLGMDGSTFGHRFGAMAQLLPRAAFELVGGWDKRFRGWGGEDGSFMRAVDTLWGPHYNLPNEVLHLWHPKLHAGSYKDISHDHHVRVWAGQTTPQANDALAREYIAATWDEERMHELVKAGHRC